MGNLLAKAARGFATGAANLANDALAELRAQRMQEFQYNLGAGDRAQARQDANDHFQQTYDLQKTGQDNSKDYQDRSLQMQSDEHKAADANRTAQLGISQKQLELAQRQEGFGEFSHAVTGATAHWQNLLAKKADVELWTPKTDKDGNQTETDKQFEARKAQTKAALTQMMQDEQPKVIEAVDKVNKAYPQFSSFIPDKGAFELPKGDPKDTGIDKTATTTSPPPKTTFAPSIEAQKPYSSTLPASQDPRWIAEQQAQKDQQARYEEKKRADDEARQRDEDEKNRRILEARRLGLGSDIGAPSGNLLLRGLDLPPNR
jgi:hypothetical protein